MRPIFDRRLVVVTGKGGTGKTTLAATLAWAAVEQGLRVVIAETGRDEQLPRLFGAPEPAGYPGRELRPGLHVLRLDPFDALAEFLALELPLPGVGRRLLGNSSFRGWLEAVPGWRELITLGKLWHLEQQEEAGRPRFDLVIVDAPATGHGLTFLDVPRVVVSAVKGGPLRRHAAEVERLVLDPERTLVLPVALPEELPITETLELVERLRRDRGLALDRVVVNRLEERPDVDLEELATAFDRLREATGTAPHPVPPGVVSQCARQVAQRTQRQADQLDRLAGACDLEIVPLPRLAGGVDGPGDLERLAKALLWPTAPTSARGTDR